MDLATAVRATLDLVPLGIALVDGDAQPVVLNAAARGLVARSDGLSLQGGRLRAYRHDDTRRFLGLIAQAARNAAEAPASLSVERPSGRRPLAVVVRPIHQEGHAGAALLVGDPEANPMPCAEPLGTLYGLTPAEARLAVALAAGHTVQETAVTLGITENTARTHLKRVLAKTETRRQGELVRLLVGGPAAMAS